MRSVPVIELAGLHDRATRPAVVAQVMRACTEIGFLSVTGTGVDPNATATMRRTVERIFAVPEDQKWAQAITRDNYRGYIPFGFFTPNDGSGTADRYEGYKLHAETAASDAIRTECALYGPNLWPRGMDSARAAVLTYWDQMDQLTHLLLGALAEGLDLAAEDLHAPMRQPLTNMTLLHYPPQAADEAGFGIHAHKDTDVLTIISPDPVGGLEVQMPDGTWAVAGCPPGGFIVNIGDMLEVWSGGRLKSTPHRVVNRSGKERYSFPYFAVPRHDVTVAPLVQALPGFDRPAVHCGHWSSEIWRTNWPDEAASADTPELGTLHAAPGA
jgi:isopenicillin N synthase-like dioxygenase